MSRLAGAVTVSALPGSDQGKQAPRGLHRNAPVEFPDDEEVVDVVLRFDPFRDFDRLAEQFFGGGGGRVPMAMPMDLYRSGDHYVLHCDLPGVDPGSVDVNVDGATLTIRAERTSRSEDGVQWLRHERPYGRFERQLTLGDGLDLDKISATYHEGVLTVTIPVAEQARPRRIQISTGASAQGRVLEGTTTGSETDA